MQKIISLYQAVMTKNVHNKTNINKQFLILIKKVYMNVLDLFHLQYSTINRISFLLSFLYHFYDQLGNATVDSSKLVVVSFIKDCLQNKIHLQLNNRGLSHVTLQQYTIAKAIVNGWCNVYPIVFGQTMGYTGYRRHIYQACFIWKGNFIIL